MKTAFRSNPRSDQNDDLVIVSNDAHFGQEVHDRSGGWHRLCLVYRIRDMLSHASVPMSVTLVDVDSLGGISRCFDSLRTVRRITPQRPLLLVSRSFRYDDFSLERAPICDASLAWPATSEGLLSGVSAALANNQSFLNRDKEGGRMKISAPAADPVVNGPLSLQ